jgi:phosphoglycerate kinase
VRHVIVEKDPHRICKPSEEILDIGPATVRRYSSFIKKARTLVWNGAMGYFEQPPYQHGTFAIARLVASRSQGKAFGVIGGGETLQAMDMVQMGEHVDLVSTGGGAMLEYLSGEKLPGIVALTEKKRG